MRARVRVFKKPKSIKKNVENPFIIKAESKHIHTY